MTVSQQRALEILSERYPAATWTSNKNGSSFVATASAARLEKLGLAVLTLHQRSWTWQAWITDEGKAVLAEHKGK